MSVYKDMAHDAGYRGEEAEQVARAIEEDHMRQAMQQQEPEPCQRCGCAALSGALCDDCFQVETGHYPGCGAGEGTHHGPCDCSARKPNNSES